MAKSFKFISRHRNLRTWVGQERIEFNNNTFETDDQRIANALREKASKKAPHGLKGHMSEIPMPAPAASVKEESPDKSKPESKPESAKANPKK